MKIAVIGTGYVGLVTGTCFSEMGNEVCCVDIDKEKIKSMKNGRIPIYEPHLEGFFSKNIVEGRLTFTSSLNEGIRGAEVIFFALPTPPNNDGSADLSYILGVANDLGKLIDKYVVVVDKSTVPVGTSERVYSHIKKHAKVNFDVVSNPEFLREGFAVDDFMKPDRVVIGTSSEKAKVIMTELYRPFVRQGNPIYFMDERSAEMTKYAANAFLATKISFMNEVANLCEATDANVDSVRLGMGSDERIGKRFLFPGIGYGGSCFPKDVQALIHTADQHEYDFKILRSVTGVNDQQKHVILNKVNRFYGGNLKGRKFAIWGLAFKPDTDDIREAASLVIINDLLEKEAEVTGTDPAAIENTRRQIVHKGFTVEEDSYRALRGADALIIATEWPLYRNPDFDRMKRLLKEPVIFDGRNLYEPDDMEQEGFYYSSIGRALVDGRKAH